MRIPPRRNRPSAIATLCLVVFSAPLLAQVNANLMGEWKIDSSRAEGGQTAVGGRAGGPPPKLVKIIKVTPMEVTVQTDTGSNRTLETHEYVLDGAEHKMPGPLSWTTMASAAWQDGKLVVDIRRIIDGPSGPISISMKDVYSVEGNVLTIERSQGKDRWKSFFNKG
jgi:hypothetical protein